MKIYLIYKNNFHKSSTREVLYLSYVFIVLLIEISPTSNYQYQNDESSEETFEKRSKYERQNSNLHENNTGLSPPVGNLATNALITSNATCGIKEPETYCKLVEHVNLKSRQSQCQVCDAHSPDKSKRHPIINAIDGSARWWQSPTLQNGKKYEWVTITIDLRQTYQVAYIVIKAALSPRPGNWILEKSTDGVTFYPWQYFAISDEECWSRYGIVAKKGKPNYLEDDEVICTSYYSKIHPLEGGEIHTSLVNGRPGAEGPSEKLIKFTIARYVRLRFQKIRTLHAELMGSGGNIWDKSVMRRYFYSIKDIAIGGHCVCFGHSNECVKYSPSSDEKCMCQHNTCGEQCEMCCPLFNQYEWGPGNSTASAACEKCQCYGHANSCYYDSTVHLKKQSINIYGTYSGGGVCIECKDFTTGVNCEKCIEGYFRPVGVLRNDSSPCVKCPCDESSGSNGNCVTQENLAQYSKEGKSIGECICKIGYTGKYCNGCAMGYRGYPNCKPCPCNLDGIVNMDCEGDCICKRNVEGKYCSKCKSGFFNLEKENPVGCTQCFCHGATSECRSSNFSITQVPNAESWNITDLQGTKIVPATKIGDYYHVSNEEFSNFDKYYWTSADYFNKKRIASYGLEINLRLSWTKARGDTSGRPISGFDVIIQTMNSMLAFSHSLYEGSNATISTKLSEHGCYLLNDDNLLTPSRSEFTKLGVPCTRYEVMEGISEIKRILFRAKFHTDQIEGMLHWVEAQEADTSSKTGENDIAKSVEICTCPIGYLGDSCESCAYGYRKSSMDSFLNECVKCNCFNHSASCDMEGKCDKCEHNTAGENCSFCLPGFYGDPTTELLNSCKPCECPLKIESNNFSPTCEMYKNSYRCTSCPVGYEGPFCERCSNGFYGNPAKEGDFCKPCNCLIEESKRSPSDTICDGLTGECFICPQNAVGWNCEECAKGFFRSSLNGTCYACDCNDFGSKGNECHQESGQCECEERFIGRTCDRCIPGCGNIEQGCPICSCDPNGSLDVNCDQVTGQCFCKEGVRGRYCNQCKDLHYGFSSSGCYACDCHEDGSDSSLCDLITGQCHCLKNVKNRNCDECEVGYWNLGSGEGCEKCGCNSIGSIDSQCNWITGQCKCKPGVGGLHCDTCLHSYYGFSQSGCKKCDPCNEMGHICDEESGRCVCPPNVEGPTCNKCSVGFWGNPALGCHPCNCSQKGSSSLQCSPESGRCSCSPGYDGDKCNVCVFGHYNYPNCVACGCESGGTRENYCDKNGICSCNEFGQCPCKENVVGQKCNRCKEGAYGLEKSNIFGCTECFCFQKTNKCSEGYFKWQRLALPNERHISPSSTQQGSSLSFLNNLVVIPENGDVIQMERDVSFSGPLYWELPRIFLGDKILSYNGYLRFRTSSQQGAGGQFPRDVLDSYPLVQIQGNHKLVLEYYPRMLSQNGYYEVRLNGDEWRLKHGPFDGFVTKEIMMVALQNLQHILIRGTNSPEFTKASLYNVSIDIAVLSSHKNDDPKLAHGIEVCECPPEYNSTSCQNPTVGYYRWYKKEYITSTVIIDLVGQARPCQCNGRASVCNIETGFCQNCSDNTGGERCERCASGYYGSPSTRCLPCPCPSIYNSHASSCTKSPPPSSSLYTPSHSTTQQSFICSCNRGYSGRSCERCEYGYYGNPLGVGGGCSECRCNPYGSVSDECHEVTGQCNCREGISGRDCSSCAPRHVIIQNTCTSCDDDCTGVLLNDIDEIKTQLGRLSISSNEAAVWKKLNFYNIESQNLTQTLNALLAAQSFILDGPNFENLAKIILTRSKAISKSCKISQNDLNYAMTKAQQLDDLIYFTDSDIRKIVHELYLYSNKKNNGDIENKIEKENLIKSIFDEIKDVSFKEAREKADLELILAKEVERIALDAVFSNGSAYINKYNDLKDMLDEIKSHISKSLSDQVQANKIILASKELLDVGKVNAELVESMIREMDLKNVMALDVLNRGAYLITEINEVLLMSEDILRDLRNWSKEIEIRENDLFEIVPLYRVKYAQPAFDHAEMLKNKARYFEGLFNFETSSNPNAFQAITAYDRMRERFEKALNFSKLAANVSKENSIKIQSLLRQYPTDLKISESEKLIEDGLTLADILDKSLKSRLNEYNELIPSIRQKIKNSKDTLRMINVQLSIIFESQNELLVPDLISYIMETLDFWDEIGLNIRETEEKIETQLQARLSTIQRSASFNSESLDIMTANIDKKLSEANFKTLSIEAVKVRKESKMEEVDEKMKHLRALIAQAKHKSDKVKVSIGPDETGTCFRLYKWPNEGGATSITFNFAPTKASNTLLFYWPSSISEDYIAIEWIDRQIRATWDLGSDIVNLTHPTRLEINKPDNPPDDPDIWYHISYERIGADVTLSVAQLSPSLPSLSTPIKYIETDESSSTVLNLAPSDLIHIGGISKQRRSGLVANGLGGCLHGLRVNYQSVGLWDFVGNEGCGPCTECREDGDGSNIERDYYFNGKGYGVVKRIQSQAFYSKSFDIKLQFRTYAENGLLFLSANEAMGQSVSIELQNGGILFRIRHSWTERRDDIVVRSGEEEKYNRGEWVKVQAVWVYQRKTQTGQLSISGKQYKKQLNASDLSLDLYNAPYLIGGLSPEFYSSKWESVASNISFVGCLKNLLIDGNSYDPLSGQYHGVETPCGGKRIHVTNFDGNGYAQYASKALTSEKFKFGFSFKTISPTGLLFLSIFSINKTIDSEEPFYGVYIENGEIYVKIRFGEGREIVELNDKQETRYDDGKMHDFRLVRKQNRFFLYLDDEQVGKVVLEPKSEVIVFPNTNVMFIGGVSSTVLEKTSSLFPQVQKNYAGCIENLYFDNEILNFNHPISHLNQNLGDCPKRFNPISPSLKRYGEYYTTGSNLRHKFLSLSLEEQCLNYVEKMIEEESLSSSLHFGDGHNSHVVIPLEGGSTLRNQFNFTLSFRTYYPNGLFFQGVKKKGGEEYHILSYLKDGQIILKFANRLWSQELVSSLSNLNDGNWHIVSIIKSDDKMYLFIDDKISSEAKVTKKMKQINKLFIGGIPTGGSDFIENSIQRPDHFRGCIKNIVINSHEYKFNGPNIIQHQVNPCFKNIEPGTYFGGDSYVVYQYNFSFNSPIELELEFRTKSKVGEIFSFIPNGNTSSYGSPSFSIFIRNGDIVAREVLESGINEAVVYFSGNSNYLCDNSWHSLKAAFLGRAISIKIDSLPPIDSLSKSAESWKFSTGTVFIGKNTKSGDRREDESGFQGCIKNVLINQKRKDWTDMAFLHNVLLNSCPT